MEHREEVDQRRSAADDAPTARALGRAWRQLPELVRRLHGPCTVSGRFAVERGRGPAVAAVAWLCGLPAAGRDVPVRLEVRPGPCGLVWARRFGTRPLVTRQRWLGGAAIAERLGAIECVFEPSAISDGIEYRQTGARLCVGPVVWSLPRPLRPRIEARARAHGTGMEVDVALSAPLLGMLVRYRGVVHAEPDA